jgi:hypothetical protein
MALLFRPCGLRGNRYVYAGRSRDDAAPQQTTCKCASTRAGRDPMNRSSAVVAALALVVAFAGEPAIGRVAGAQATCPAGQTMTPKGVCTNLPAGTATSACPSGVANGTGGCTLPRKGTCPAGTTVKPDGSCAPTPTTCPAGTAMQNGACVKAPLTCPAGTVVKPDGSCAPPPTTCPAGTAMQNGACVKLPTTCPTGTTMRADGTCGSPLSETLTSIRAPARTPASALPASGYSPGWYTLSVCPFS